MGIICSYTLQSLLSSQTFHQELELRTGFGIGYNIKIIVPDPKLQLFKELYSDTKKSVKEPDLFYPFHIVNHNNSSFNTNLIFSGSLFLISKKLVITEI